MKNKTSLLALVACIVLVALLFILNKTKDDAKYKELNTISTNDIIFGNESAPKSLIIYFDYNCGYCKKFFNEVYPKLKTQQIDKGELKLVVRLICKPTDKTALKAYQTCICTNTYGNYENLHNLLMHKSEIIYTDHFQQLTDDYININTDIAECILNNNNSNILNNIVQFQSLKTRGTPTFVIGNKIVVGYITNEEINRTINEEFN